METKQALEIIKQVAAAHVGNLKEHEAIQAAVAAVEMALRFEELGGSKSDLAQIVNDATAEKHTETAV